MKKNLLAALLTLTLSAAISTVAFADENTLSYGMSGDDVYELQNSLYDLGYLNSAPDGIFGEDTESAVIAFQYTNGLEADGVAGDLTMYYLYSGYASSGSSSSNYDDGIRYGSAGNEVYNIQSILYDLGYLTEEPTGYFGELTENAVINFQYDNDLDADGVVGSQTLEVLGLSETYTFSESDSSYSSDSYESAISLEEAQNAIVAAAYSTPSTGSGLCASWVTQVLKNSGVLTYGISSLRSSSYSYATDSGLSYGYDTGFNANDYWAYVCYSSDLSDLQPGMVIATRSSFSYLGQQYGHVGIYVGNDTVISSIGYLEELSVSEWISRYNNYSLGSTARWGYIPF